jgi:hypothetical protein
MRFRHGGFSGFGIGNRELITTLDNVSYGGCAARVPVLSGWKGVFGPLRLPDVKPPCLTAPGLVPGAFLFQLGVTTCHRYESVNSSVFVVTATQINGGMGQSRNIVRTADLVRFASVGAAIISERTRRILRSRFCFI